MPVYPLRSWIDSKRPHERSTFGALLGLCTISERSIDRSLVPLPMIDPISLYSPLALNSVTPVCATLAQFNTEINPIKPKKACNI